MMEILSTSTKKEIGSLPFQRVLDAHSTTDHLPAAAGYWENVNFLGKID
jgi:hypothetical protein